MAVIQMVLLSMVMLWAGQVAAAFPGQASEGEDGFYYQPEEQDWREGEVVLPALPDEDKLLPLSLDSHRFRYLIDSESLYVDPEHPLVRYTLVLVSPAGVRNIMYEGMRCDRGGQFKRYAYSVGDKPLQRARSAEWQNISAADGYHQGMFRHYMCSFTRKLDREGILQRIRYPEDSHNGY